MCLVSCPPFSHAVAILKLVSPTDWVEGSQCSPPVSNDDTARSAPTICGVCIRELVACERSIHVGFHATGSTNWLQMGAPLLTPPVFGIQHQGCEIDTAMPGDETIASRGGKTSLLTLDCRVFVFCFVSGVRWLCVVVPSAALSVCMAFFEARAALGARYGVFTWQAVRLDRSSMIQYNCEHGTCIQHQSFHPKFFRYRPLYIALKVDAHRHWIRTNLLKGECFVGPLTTAKLTSQILSKHRKKKRLPKPQESGWAHL